MIILITLLVIWALWIFYLAVMSLYRANAAGTLSTPAKWLGYPVLATWICQHLLNPFDPDQRGQG